MPVKRTNRLSLTFKCAGLFVCVLFCSGCSKEKQTTSEKTTADKPTLSVEAVEPTTGTQELEFFTERYLMPQERLQRRQSRIEATLANP